MITPYYQDTAVVIYHADCRDVLPSLTNIDAVITDPPYGIANNRGGPESRKHIKGNYLPSFIDDQQYLQECCANVIKICITIAKRVAFTPGRKNMWFYPPATDVGCFFQPAATGCSFWGRPTWQPILFYGSAPHCGEQLRSLHYQITEASQNNGHPCSKPIKAWSWLVNKTAKKGEMILDPFMGSGTTLRIAKDMNMRAIGIDIEEKYCEIAARRMNQEVFAF